MTLSDICKGTYPACTKIKSQSAFITALFEAAGGTLYGSDSYKKQLFKGDKPFTASLKESLPSQINTNALTDFFYNNIADTKLPDVVAGFGIPEKEAINKRALASALAIQFKAIIEFDNGSAENVVILEYQNRKANAVDGAIIAPATALYPGDQFYIRETHRPSYQVNIYEKIQHTWIFDNIGTQEWKGRKLYFSNHDSVRPKAEDVYVLIPDTLPQKSVKVSVEMDARGFEGVSECKWIMIDSEGNDCFPNCSSFAFTISSTFDYR